MSTPAAAAAATTMGQKTQSIPVLGGVSGLLLLLVVVGFSTFQQARMRPSPAIVTPSATLPTTTPPWQANATLLALTCTDACGTGGTCNQTSTGVVVRCLTCGHAGYTGIERCVDTTYCATHRWCSTTEAGLLLTFHNNLLSHITVVNGTAQPYTGSFEPTLITAFLQARRTTLLAGSNALPDTWFNDQTGWWGNQLPLYLSGIQATAYESYVDAIKPHVCTRTWMPKDGTCVPPVL